MVFEKDQSKVGEQLGEFVVKDTSVLVEELQKADIKIAMLTVPAVAAQEVTDTLIKAGVKAILNYAPINLNVPEGVHVQHTDPVTHLQRMTYYL
jgi:redox-sensing transcriptional repressor